VPTKTAEFEVKNWHESAKKHLTKTFTVCDFCYFLK